MKIIELDLTNCRTLYDLHEHIRVAFNYPDWYEKTGALLGCRSYSPRTP